MPSALEVGRHQTALVTPNGKRMKILLTETWKKVLRLQREVKAEGFRARFHCPDCQQIITLTVPHPKSPRFECGCTIWMGR